MREKKKVGLGCDWPDQLFPYVTPESLLPARGRLERKRAGKLQTCLRRTNKRECGSETLDG